LFAAKPGRVNALSQQGFLVDAIAAWAPSADDCKNADLFWRGQKFAPRISVSGGSNDAGYRGSLAAYATWCAADQPLATRCSARIRVARSQDRVRAPTAGRLSTLARVAWEWGARGESVAVLLRLLKTLQGGQLQLGEPFWPAHARFDEMALGRQPADWFTGAAVEQFEQTLSFSSVFSGTSPVLAWLCGQPFAPPKWNADASCLRPGRVNGPKYRYDCAPQRWTI
jgi:hypothetical protein